jgi:hypothetical protein
MARTPSPRLRYRPSLEPLEDRTLPATFFVAPAPTGNDGNSGLTAADPFEHIQHALDVAAANPGPDTINVASGTYVEQLRISSDVTLIGAGAGNTIIKCPPTLDPDPVLPPQPSTPTRAIVEMDSAAMVTMFGFTVTGPGPEAFRSVSFGILVVGNATLNLHDTTVTAIRSPLDLNGQLDTDQTGAGIGVGIQSRAGIPGQVGLATINDVMITDYQKTGIRVAFAGSMATITHNTITGFGLSTTIAQNGITIVSGAKATVSDNTISLNEFEGNPGQPGGPDLFNDQNATGIIIVGGGAGTTIAGNNVFDNDIGIYSAPLRDPSLGPAASVTGNTVLNNRFHGVVLEEGFSTASNNTISGSINGLVVVSFSSNTLSRRLNDLGVTPLVVTPNSVATVTGNTIFNNSEKGVWVVDQSVDGVFPVATVFQNTIFNNGTGVIVGGGPNPPETENDQTVISQNSIFANTPGLGIDLANDGVTLNDPGDADTGPNNLKNFPVLTRAAIVGSGLELEGFARPGSVIELFIADPDPTGFGEGKTYLATRTEGSADDLDNTTGSYGPGPVNGLVQGSDTTNRFRFFIPLASLPAPVAAGTMLTSTATLGDPATSEFSGNITVTGVPVPPVPPLPPLPSLPPSKQFQLASTPVVDPAALSPRFAVTTGKAIPTYLAVGSGPGYPAMVRVFDYATGVERFRFFPYGPSFTGGVNVATGDVTGDGVPDIITGVRSGAGPHVKVFDGVTGAEIASFFAYAPGFLGGVSVAAGDVDGDGHADIITGAGPGADPHVVVFSGANLSVLRSFDAYAPAFAGGVHVAAGDINGDGRADIVTAPILGPTHVRAIDGLTGADLASFLAFSGFNGGLNVALGDVDGDGRADIITGAGPGAAPHVKVFSGADLSVLRSFLAFAPSFSGGVVVGALDANGDGRADLVVTPQQGPAHVRLLDGLTLAELDSFFAFHPALNGGAALS